MRPIRPRRWDQRGEKCQGAGFSVNEHPMLHEPDSLQIGRTHQSPLIGRERELDTLRGLLYQLERYAGIHAGNQHTALPGIPLDTQRASQCVILMGEAGIGKTRLAEEVSREAQRRGWTVLWSRIYAQERGIPYRLWTEVLRKALGQGVWQEEETTPVVPSGLSVEQKESRLWDAVYQLLTSASETTPLIVALDDIQWADA